MAVCGAHGEAGAGLCTAVGPWLAHTVTVYKRQRCGGGRVGYTAEAVIGGHEAVRGADHRQPPPAREGPPGNHHLAIDSSFIRSSIMALGRF